MAGLMILTIVKAGKACQVRLHFCEPARIDSGLRGSNFELEDVLVHSEPPLAFLICTNNLGPGLMIPVT